MTEKTLAQAEMELNEAREAYAAAERREDEARREMTAALNRLNDKQKAFDAAVKAVRDQAPRATNWWQLRHEKPASEHDRVAGLLPSSASTRL